jgi:hypothetical protein
MKFMKDLRKKSPQVKETSYKKASSLNMYKGARVGGGAE